MRQLTFLLVFVCMGCHMIKKANDTESVSKAFDDKWTLYSALASNWPTDDCDWLEFQSLRDAALVRPGVVETAELSPGEWFRTPGKDQACYVDGVDKGSKSTISRDMLLGLAVYLWQMGDAENIQQVIDYASAHNGVMGKGDEMRTGIRTPLLSTYQAMASRIGNSGIPLPPKVENPDPNATDFALTADSADALFVQTGYAAHLTVLHIYLRGLIWGEVSELEARLLKAHAERMPRNAFYQAVYHKFEDGDQSEAEAVLLDEALFPSDSLPTSGNYCTSYIWQRDDGTDDWLGCVTGDVHSGADWLFAAAVIRNGLREASK